MVYLDTSALVPLFVAEVASQRIRARLGGLMAGQAAISDWTLVEFASAVGARVRSGNLSEGDGHEAMRAMASMADASLVRLTPREGDFDAAWRLVGRFASGLRAGDALHLAIAARAGARMLTLDRLMRRAALSVGVEAESP